MATATRTFTRALRTSARPAFTAAPRIAFRQSGRRFYSSEPAAKQGSSAWLWLAGAAAVGGAGAWFYSSKQGPATPKVFAPKFEDYQAVYNEIANRLDEKDDYDDGSYGPVLLRLAWHASGTYDQETGTGGSNGATMRFSPESDHGANAGLKAARDFLEPVKGECCRQRLKIRKEEVTDKRKQRSSPGSPTLTSGSSAASVPSRR
jgi:cytochrome c peroxidase